MKATSSKARRQIRHKRVRRKLEGTAETPRMAVFKSAKHIYVQLIDDSTMNTLLSASSLTPKVIETIGKDKIKKSEIAKTVGQYIGELAVAQGIKTVRFDRGGSPFHGRVKSLADGAREAGLKF